ncbi:DNA-3-methyladenine glycosylase [soil metagenome]
MSFLPSVIASHFEMSDPVLFKFIAKIETFEVVEGDDYFASLCSSIVSQQLSTRVANVIFERLLHLFPDQKLDPKKTLELSEAELRAVGLSFAKIKYIKDLSSKVLSGELQLENLPAMSNDEVIAELTQVKGIGKWTAEMFLMFTLGRVDVFSHGDLGLKKAIQKIYGLIELPTEAEMVRLE